MTDQVDQRRHFSERRGRGPKTEPLPFEVVRRTIVGSIDRFLYEGYFQEAFGDPMSGERQGKIRNPDIYFLRATHRENVWPYRDGGTHGGERWKEWDEDTLFDVIEVLHGVVSKPVWKPLLFHKEFGQQAFRAELNEVLPLAQPAYEMDVSGQIIERGPSGFRQLVEEPIPDGADDELVTRRIQNAVERFRARTADNEERRVAVRELAGVLEVLRPHVREHMLSADENALFQLANGFAIRHNNREQRGDYDGATWLSWAFYVYLATIHAVLRTIEQQEQA